MKWFIAKKAREKVGVKHLPFRYSFVYVDCVCDIYLSIYTHTHFYFITVAGLVSCRTLIPWDPEVKGRVNPSVTLRGLELVTIGEQPKAEPTELPLRIHAQAH